MPTATQTEKTDYRLRSTREYKNYIDGQWTESSSGKTFDDINPADSGVSDAGLMTTVLPQTSAGMLFQAGMAIGKFHGVISPATPSGIRTAMLNLLGSSEGVVTPNSRRPSPAIRKAMSIAA